MPHQLRENTRMKLLLRHEERHSLLITCELLLRHYEPHIAHKARAASALAQLEYGERVSQGSLYAFRKQASVRRHGRCAKGVAVGEEIMDPTGGVHGWP